jgi:hypothetical protein
VVVRRRPGGRAPRHVREGRGIFVNLSVDLQIAAVQMTFLNDAFGTVPLALDNWLICVGLASVVLCADELSKVVGRWLGR